MTGFARDLRLSLRILVKSPGISALAVGALALGIGVTATMFSIVYGALLRGLPFEGGDRVVTVIGLREGRRVPTSIHDYAAFRDEQGAFESVEALYEGSVNLSWGERPERFQGAFVTANGLSALGVMPALGRPFRADEAQPGAPLVAILAHHVWRDHFDGSPDVLGRIVRANGEQAEIVGVMPEGFRFPQLQDIWLPLRVDAVATPRGEGPPVHVYGRLRAGTSRAAARVDLTGIADRLAREWPDTNEGLGVDVQPFLKRYVGDRSLALLTTMLGAVSLVLLIACANVANLLLARAAVRMREVGIRTALGATRWRVVSRMLAEAVVLALAGGVAGAGLATLGIDLFNRTIAGTQPPFYLVFRVDGPILLFVLGISVASALIAGGIPAWKASGADLGRILRDESRASSGLHVGSLTRALVVGEVALSVGLLVAAGLMIKSVAHLRAYDFGIRGDGVFTARVLLFDGDYPTSDARRQFFDQLRLRLDQVPGVELSSLGSVVPGTTSPSVPVGIEGVAYAQERDRPLVRRGWVTPGYFETVGVEPTLGRDFALTDEDGAERVAIVNASFAQKYLHAGTPLGQRFQVGTGSRAPWVTVVGVVPDLWMQGAGATDLPQEGFYTPFAQGDMSFANILARGPADPLSLTAGVRDAVASIQADTPIYGVDTVAGRIAASTWTFKVVGGLFVVFGGVALFLASVGLYAVMAFSVGRRRAEVGIRMALGAEGRQVLGLVLRQGVGQTVMGLVLGLGFALLLSRASRLLLFEVDPADPVVFVGVAVVLLATGVAASTLPARRATRVDPVVALRNE